MQAKAHPELPISIDELIKALIAICHDAGRVIMQVYTTSDLSIEQKSDDSPVTQADIQAHQVIAAGLKALTPNIPLVSEEGHIDHTARQQWRTLWCVDPLDGTREFIAKTDEFTVNIALIHEGEPVLGIVYCPTSEALYWGHTLASQQAFQQQKNQRPTPLSTRSVTANTPLVVTASRRNGQANQKSAKALLEEHFTSVESLVSGSSLKMCLIAAGVADIYPRLHPTCEWDTAAADAILRAAGGVIINAETLKPLDYNQRASLLNPWFFALGDRNFSADVLTRLNRIGKTEKGNK